MSERSNGKFENAVFVPAGWEKFAFGKLVNIRRIIATPNDIDTHLPCIDLEDIGQGNGKVIKYSDADESASGRAIFKRNDVLFGRLRAYLRKYWFATSDGYCSTEIWPLTPARDEILPYYIFLLVQTKDFLDMATVSYGTHMPRTDWQVVSEKQFAIPPLPEQRAIAEALGDMDRLLAGLDRLIAKKKAMKQGAMQALLSGRVRLPGFSGAWEKYKISDLAVVLKGQGLSKGKVRSEGKNKCILYGELFTSYSRVITDVNSSTDYDEGIPSSIGDVLMPGSTTTVGIDLAIASALMAENVLLGGDINIIRAKTKKYHPVFLAYYLTEVMKYEIEQIAQGTTIIHLHAKNIQNLEIKIPGYKEQKAIAFILTDLEEEIYALESERMKFDRIKQGMMQDLLTGRVRLV